MNASAPLAGLGVVLTRPRAQADALARLLEARGARVIVFPSLDIVPVEASEESLAALRGASLALFVSANAVEHGLEAARRTGPWPASVAVGAVGEATATALRNSGFAHVISPKVRFDSEALLACPELQAVAGQNIIVFRGVGGRERIRSTLESRGARVSYVECYRRVRPPTDPAPLHAALSRGEVQAVHAMSAESVENFLALAGPGAALSAVALVVPHEAIARHPLAARFARAVVAAGGPEGVAAALAGLRSAA